MGSPTIFSGKYTKLLTQKGLLQQGGAVNQFDGNRNYIKNSTFEANVLDGWNRVKTTITSNLPTGTPTIGQALVVAPSIASFYVSGGSAPFDSYALYFGNPVTTVVAGEGIISDAFTVEPGDLGKVLTFKLYYKSELGASTDNWSGQLASQTWAVYIYDQTAGAWLQPAGFLGMNQNSGVGIVSGTFQSSVVPGQQYRIAVIALRNTTSTSALQIDNIYVGSQTAPIGPVVTDWVSYTPTGTWVSGATYIGKYRRVGDSIQCSVKIAITGPVTATDLQISIPSGLTIDSAKMASGDFLQSVFGTGHGFRSTGGTHYNFQIGLASSTLLFFTYQNQLTSQVVSISNTAPFTWANGDIIHATFMVPVTGFSSNVQLSNDTDTRVVDLKVNNAISITPSGTIGTSFSTATNINFNATPVKDSHAGYSAGVYTIPVSGDYFISARVEMSHTSSTGTFVGLSVGVNNVERMTQAIKPALSNAYPFVSGLVTGLVAGDQIAIRLFGDSSAKAFVTSVVNDFTVHRLSGPSVVAASETVAARYNQSSGQSIPSATSTTLVYPTKVYDTHGMYNSSTGIATIPVSGKYRVTASILYDAFSWSAGQTAAIYPVKNGALHSILRRSEEIPTAVTRYLHIAGSMTIDCNAGDTIRINTDHNTGVSRPMYSFDAAYNYVCIERVGN